MPTRLIIFFFIFFFPILSFAEEYCIFIPPKNWQFVDPKQLGEYVVAAFVGKNKNIFYRPMLNFAEEQIDIDEQKYIEAVKEKHGEMPDTIWRQIGKQKTMCGEATIAEIEVKSKYGPLKMIQAIVVKENNAYILTGSVSKDDFYQFNKEFLLAIKSLYVTDDLYSFVKDENKKSDLKKRVELVASDKDLEQLEKHLKQSFSSEGLFWQMLLLKKAYEGLKK